ncbi:bifunctional 2-polyprenyl-6-hydroxyphenol methylase/3-demethylubiquinol 3-O-methyltransferase UbiG [Sphingobium subterraneum]|uniref:Ubiquinone biosynthesis O-methyltransferase n=1 Tax=Sphingobium subterraneum TaxID=627688 RepID=A0A841IYN6_9SPHN|nr:bifunctional 2-polyprenyl-6-hydroxyphenol methylase/3-demethylubiquinol 3-O-methyltransferase UbiG [Sphingobium subterraneum]MBB6123524.1 2-polyprenyl-6-hydroxyphenyl methylase/3-demethylubiquinone-9 3-methyltransferase [Sphingobium subterraneum]
MASNAAPQSTGTIDPAEAAHFGTLAADWWNPAGSSAMLHKLNPVRLAYIRRAVDAHWHGDTRALRPLDGRRALDVGCGAGLLCEPLARLGAAVTGIDAAHENIAVATAHAEGQGLVIDYRATGIESLMESGELAGTFDLVTSMEVIEHVTDPAQFIRGLADALAPGGLMILSTPNRTVASKIAMITLAEGLGRIPKGTHDWNKFLNPDELEALLDDAGLQITDRTGIGFDPRFGLVLSANEAINYIVTVVRSAPSA